MSNDEFYYNLNRRNLPTWWKSPDWWIGALLMVSFWGFIIAFFVAMVTGAYAGGN